MVIHFIYTHFYDYDNKRFSIGGIQTYINNLSKCLYENNYSIVIHQLYDKPFDIVINGIRIIGYNYKSYETFGKYVIKHSGVIKKEDLIIFGSEFLNTKCDNKTICIQHGISWDIPCQEVKWAKKFLLSTKKFLNSRRIIKKVTLTNATVCVDYNFLNWFKATTVSYKTKFYVIPNFADVPNSRCKKNDDVVNIIFARRFYYYRGTRIFVDAIKPILDEYKGVCVTVAGEGPDEEMLKKELKQYANVRFIKYNSEDAFNIHKDMHIALIPTIGSEGTSLSLLEAMAASCAPICTNVGGMTNIVINRFNGIMIMPDSEELYCAIKEFMDNPSYRDYISKNAYDTCFEAFSKHNWEEEWKKVIKRVLEE